MVILAMVMMTPLYQAHAQNADQTQGQEQLQNNTAGPEANLDMAPAVGAGSGWSAPALVMALDRAVLATQINAAIAEMPFRPGQAFNKGDLLVRFQCQAYEAQRDVAKASVDAANAERRVKQRLFDLKSIGQLDLDVSKAGLRRAQAELRLYQVQVDRCSIKAPFDGLVVDWLSRPHASVELGDDVLEIVASQPLEIEAIIPSSWLVWLDVGQKFQVMAAVLGSSVLAEVSRLGAVVDPASQAVVLRGRLAEPPKGLLPGMRANAVFDVPDRRAP